jgi:hypothetical protein
MGFLCVVEFTTAFKRPFIKHTGKKKEVESNGKDRDNKEYI